QSSYQGYPHHKPTVSLHIQTLHTLSIHKTKLKNPKKTPEKSGVSSESPVFRRTQSCETE
ncbi:hypothetical protein, partial [Gluconobacter japonicus]|uniref:hypothetical protein n=1 Tax=Gluconobacter japonicus TaxID=376620 RepID=UPI001E36F390